MKYEFKTVDLDTFELVYTKNEEEKKIQFKRDIEMASYLDGITARARIKLNSYLAKMGMTEKDLIIKKVDGNKTIYDESNFRNCEKGFIGEESVNAVNELAEKCFKMNIIELFDEIGIDYQNDAVAVELFTNKFMTVIKGENKNPSQSK